MNFQVAGCYGCAEQIHFGNYLFIQLLLTPLQLAQLFSTFGIAKSKKDIKLKEFASRHPPLQHFLVCFNLVFKRHMLNTQTKLIAIKMSTYSELQRSVSDIE